MAAHHATASAVLHPLALTNPLAITSSQRVLVIGIGVVAIAALIYAYVLVREVLKHDQGTPKMQEIAKAVQEGAARLPEPAVPHAGRLLGHRLRRSCCVLPVNQGGF